MLVIRRNVEDLKEKLANEAGADPASDRYIVGYITACRDLLNVDIEEQFPYDYPNDL